MYHVIVLALGRERTDRAPDPGAVVLRQVAAEADHLQEAVQPLEDGPLLQPHVRREPRLKSNQQ